MPAYNKTETNEAGELVHAWAYAKWGDKLVGKINKFTEEVAQRISVMDGGHNCEYLETSSHTHRKEVFLFADFKDGMRGWFRSSDIDNPVFTSWKDTSAAFPFG